MALRIVYQICCGIDVYKTLVAKGILLEVRMVEAFLSRRKCFCRS